MKYLTMDIVLKEVPDLMGMSYQITGCPMRCKGCHSPELRNKLLGEELTNYKYKQHLNDYANFIDVVIFLGGEWYEQNLVEKLIIAHDDYNLKTCLYTGQVHVSDAILEHLDFVKYGPYVEKYGGLDSPTTNQRFYDLNTNKDITYKFREE
jgi:anaerobic ribonucleoside-triphosphate reductase activating protein